MKAKIILTACAVVLSLNIKARTYPVKPPLKKENALGVKMMSLSDMTKNLEFDFCKANVRPVVNQQLDELAKYAIEQHTAIALRGHADAIGTYVGNWKMSDKRALSVKDYLVEKGVPADKIVTTPFGSTIPIASNKTATGRQHNRRVEIVLQETKSK